MKAILIVLDGVGVGSLPDHKEYDPELANTFVNSLGSSQLNNLPFLKRIGFDYFFDNGVIPSKGIVGKLAPITKDNDTGPIHWEMMGIKRKERLPLYPNGVPQNIIFPGFVFCECGSDYLKPVVEEINDECHRRPYMKRYVER